MAINEDILKGKWKELKGSVQKQWGKITDDQFTQISGDRTKLIGQVQTAYGVAREEAERQVKAWEDMQDQSRAA